MFVPANGALVSVVFTPRTTVTGLSTGSNDTEDIGMLEYVSLPTPSKYGSAVLTVLAPK